MVQGLTRLESIRDGGNIYLFVRYASFSEQRRPLTLDYASGSFALLIFSCLFAGE